ncbi:MAG: 4Fe-4S binding protein [Bacteroidales bacterium]|nr:4Fe-4S binding protein [Bacteroidales bacterium]
MRKYRWPLIIWLLFEIIAVVTTITTKNLFLFINFTYIGTSLGVGGILMKKGWKHARRLVQFLVGVYLLVFLGFLGHENMQIEGFWYYLFSGVFAAATLHYAIAKIFGPLLFGRGWCGYCCWTAMILDLLPYKTPNKNGVQERKKIGFIRYIFFAASLIFVVALLILGLSDAQMKRIMFISFIATNVLYYAVGIVLAILFKDNRAFCKYICPVTVFLKPMSYYSRLRVVCDQEKCIGCNACRRACPMEVDMLDPSRKRTNGTECILCGECERACPQGALRK